MGVAETHQVYLHLWNWNTGAWEGVVLDTAEEDTWVGMTGSRTLDLADVIDASGFAYVLLSTAADSTLGIDYVALDIEGAAATATWGSRNLETAQGNIAQDVNNLGGFVNGPFADTILVTPINGGIRVRSPILRELPTVTFTGSNWAYTRAGNGAAIKPAPIDDYFLTRGYMPQTEDERLLGKYVPKNFKGLTLNFRSWNPMVTLKTQTDGENEFKPVHSILRKDRRRSYINGKAAVDTMNNNTDHGAEKREDYSILLAEPDQFELGPDEGVDPEILQECTEGAKLRASGKWLQLEVSGFQGRSEITSIEIKATTGARRAGAIA